MKTINVNIKLFDMQLKTIGELLDNYCIDGTEYPYIDDLFELLCNVYDDLNKNNTICLIKEKD